MKYVVPAFCVMFMVFTASVKSQTRMVEKIEKTGNEIVIPYEKYILSNGLTLIIHEDHSDPVVHTDVTYHVGSAREEIGKSGFAHFFEHMMFQGSDNVADEQHFKIVSDAGGTLNGSTNRDRTNYYETVPANQLEKMLWLEADRMGFLLDAVTQKKFEIQRSTVKNERGQNYDNRPYGLAGENSAKALYPYGHPYSWLTIGYLEDLNRSDVNDLKNFFLRWYGPNNAVLTVGGDVNPAEVVKLAEKYFGSIPRGPEVSKMTVPLPVLDKDRYVSYVDNYARVPLLSIVYPTVPLYHKDMGALACLSSVIGQGRNSVMYQQLVKKQLALQANGSSNHSELGGEFSFSLVPMPGKSLAYMDSLFRSALDSFEARGMTDEDVAKFKGAIEAQQLNSLQSVAGKVSQLAAFQTFADNPNKIADLIKMYTSVTREDVMRVYNEYLKGKHAVVLSVLPKGQEKMIAAADNYKVDNSNYKSPDYGYAGLKYTKAKDNFDRSKIPASGPNPVVKVPAFWKKELPGGIKIIGTESNEIPTVTLTVTLPGGHLLTAKDTSKIGLANFFAAMMNEDTKNYTAERMAVELQKLGGSITVSSGFNGTTFNVQALKKNLDKTLVLLEERIFRPNFTDAAFSRLQKQTIEGFKQSKAQPAFLASQHFDKIIYNSGNFLTLSESGTERTITNLAIKDVQDFYNESLASQGTKVVVVGDVTAAEIVSRLAFLEKLPNRKLVLPKFDNKPRVTDKIVVYLIDIPKAAQTEFRVGYATGVKYDATGPYYRLRLLNYTLGGDFNSRLNIELRENKGWTYSARSNFNSDEYSGDFVFSSGIRADATDSALTDLLGVIKQYSLSGIKEDELKFMKNSLGQRDALSYETGLQKAGFIRRMLDYDLPANYVELQNKILAGITKAEIDALAKKSLKADQMFVLLVGDKAMIMEGVKKAGYQLIEMDIDGNIK